MTENDRIANDLTREAQRLGLYGERENANQVGATAVRAFAEWLEKIAEHDPKEMSMLHYPSMANQYLTQLDK